MIQHARRLFLALGLAAATAFSTAATPAAAQARQNSPFNRCLL